MNTSLLQKRYYNIGEVSEICGVKAHVLRYWEQEFPQLQPKKRRGNRRYYQQKDIELIHTIKALLYEQGFTILGAKGKLAHKKTAVEPNILQGIITELQDIIASIPKTD